MLLAQNTKRHFEQFDHNRRFWDSGSCKSVFYTRPLTNGWAILRSIACQNLIFIRFRRPLKNFFPRTSRPHQSRPVLLMFLTVGSSRFSPAMRHALAAALPKCDAYRSLLPSAAPLCLAFLLDIGRTFHQTSFERKHCCHV